MNKGFTLIELIGTVVILAAISLIAFPAITGLLKNSNQKIDEKTEEFIESSALDYANDHKDNEFPVTKTVQDLVDEGYLSTTFICNNCELASDKVLINYNGQKFTVEYDFEKNEVIRKEGENTCLKECGEEEE